jgi:hypothetical protein
MGNRAIFLLHEQGESYYFTAHHGANALSPLLRLTQAKQLQEQLPQPQSVAHIFEHLDYDGKYQPERLQDSDMFFQAISLPEMKVCLNDFQNRSNFEMRFIIDLDRNDFQMTYNPNCPWYRTMGSFTIDLEVGIDNVKKLLAHAEDRNIKDFGRLLTIYENSTGLADKLESARGYMRFEEYLDSPQAEADRRRYRELIDRQAEPDEEEMEER